MKSIQSMTIKSIGIMTIKLISGMTNRLYKINWKYESKTN